MDLTEIRARVRTNIVDTSTIRPRISDTRLDRIIDDACEFVARATKSYFEDVSLIVPDGLDSVAFAADTARRFISLRMVNESVSKREIHIRKYDEISDYRAANVPVASVPYICTVVGSVFYVAPAVFGAKTFNVKFCALPPTLVVGADVLALKFELHPTVVAKASALGWEVLEEPAKSKKWDEDVAVLLSIASPDNTKQKTPRQ